MKILVCDRLQASGLEVPVVPWAAISIKNEGMSQVQFPIENRVGVLRMDFDDLDRIPRDNRHCTLFNEKMANEVWDFVLEVWDKIGLLLIHCNHGMSRSPAIAAAICKVKYGNDNNWFETKTPNRRVYKLLLSVAHGRGLI